MRAGTSRVVLDLDASEVDLQVLRHRLARHQIAGLEEIIVVRGGKALEFYP